MYCQAACDNGYNPLPTGRPPTRTDKTDIAEWWTAETVTCTTLIFYLYHCAVAPISFGWNKCYIMFCYVIKERNSDSHTWKRNLHWLFKQYTEKMPEKNKIATEISDIWNSNKFYPWSSGCAGASHTSCTGRQSCCPCGRLGYSACSSSSWSGLSCQSCYQQSSSCWGHQTWYKCFIYQSCSRSRRRAASGSKRKYLDYTHGLFIT